MDLEGFLNLSMLVLVPILSICFVVIKVKKTQRRATLIWQSLGLGFILFAAASLISLLIYTDALNILVFLVLYALAFLVSSAINVGIIVLKKH